MSARGYRHNRLRGRKGGGQPSFFFDWRRSSLGESRKRETLSVNPPLTLSSNKEAQSDDEVLCEIEDYFEEAKKGEPVQVGDLPQYVLSSHAWLEQVHLVVWILLIVEHRL